MSQGRLLVLGNLKGSALSALETARLETGYEATILARADDAIHELDRPQLRALVVDLTTPGAARFCQEARARRALFNVPLIALSPKLTDLAFSNAQRWGADDVVALGAADALKARLEFIPEIAAPLAMATRGEAVIADTDRGRCDVLGRVLANAGFNVKYATDPVATRFYLSKANVKLFVLNTELGEPATMIAEARAAGNQADWVITTKTLAVEPLRDELTGLERVIVMPSHGPPENALFAINLLQPSADAQRRAELRALHAAVVVFRALSWERDEYGFTYSVSAGGLYLRTLVRPPRERVWLELNPPNVARKVKLLAEVAWSRTFGQPGAETAPPGFGVRIVDGQGDDLALWKQGFESLEIKTPAGSGMPELRPSTTSFRIPLPAQAQALRANSLPPTGGSMRPGKSTANLSRTVRSLNPGADLSPGRPSAEVVVPSSTWSAPEYTPRPPSVELPRPPSTSSQAAVLAALRTSLLPNAPLDLAVSPVIRELDDNRPTMVPDERVESNPATANTVPATPPPIPSQLAGPFLGSPAPPAPPDFADALPADPLPIKLDPSALLDPDADNFDPNANRRAGGRVVRTVLGVGGMPAGSSFAPAPPPPLSLDQLDAQAAPNTLALANDAPAPPVAGKSTASGESSGEFIEASEIASVPPAPTSRTPSAAFISSAPLDSMVGAPPERGGPMGNDRVLGLFDKTEPDQRAFVLETPAPAATNDASADIAAAATEAKLETDPKPARDTAQQTTLVSNAVDPAKIEAAPKGKTVKIEVARAEEPPRKARNSDGAQSPVRGAEPPPRRSRGDRTPSSPWQDETAPATSGGPVPAPAKAAAPKSKAPWIAAAVVVLAVLGGTQIYGRFGAKGHSGAVAKPTVQKDPAQDPSANTQAAGRKTTPADTAVATAAAPADTPAVGTQGTASSASAVASATAVASAIDTSAIDTGAMDTGSSAPTAATGAASDTTEGTTAPAPSGADTQVTVRAPAPSAPDTITLAEDMAWLYVHSSVTTHVFVHGVDHGETNQWLKSRCGGRFVRLGTAPGTWLSVGVPVKLRCRQANELDLEPSEQPQ